MRGSGAEFGAVIFPNSAYLENTLLSIFIFAANFVILVLT
jgi:hypothetical protein